MLTQTKFERRYTLGCEVQAGADNKPQSVTIELPYTVEFEITRQSLSSSNTGKFRLFNLAENTRNLIFKDKYAWTEYRNVQFRAGYEQFQPLLFNGSVREASSERNGVNMITTIDAYDGGFSITNGFSSLTLAAGQAAKDVINTLSADLPKLVSTPIIGDFPRTSARGEALLGNTWNLIQEKCNGLCSIDNQQLKVLQDNECINGPIPVINSASGLLGSPKRSGAQLEFEMLFEPRLTIGQIVKLESSTNRLFNGFYKVMGFSHKGIISGAVSGECRTSVSLWLGTQELRVIKGNSVQ